MVAIGKRQYSFWDDTVGDLLRYLFEPRPCATKIVLIAYIAKAFDLHFILNRAILLEWKPEIITIGLKIISMKMEHFLQRVLPPVCTALIARGFRIGD